MDEFLKLIARIAAALESIAKSLEGASIASTTVTAAPAAAVVATPVEDDLGLGPGPAGSVAVETFTADSVKAIAAGVANAKGRPAVKEVLKSFKADTLKDIKAEQYADFVAALRKL